MLDRVRARRRLPASRASGPPRSEPASSTGSVPWPPGVLEVDPEPAREPRNRSERQFQDRLGGESPPIRPRPGRSGQCARAVIRTRRGPGRRRDRRGSARPRGATFAPGCPAVNGAPRRCARFTPPRPGGRVDKTVGTQPARLGVSCKTQSGILGETGATEELGAVQAPRRRWRLLRGVLEPDGGLAARCSRHPGRRRGRRRRRLQRQLQQLVDPRHVVHLDRPPAAPRPPPRPPHARSSAAG